MSGDTVVCCFSFEVKACRGGGGWERGRERMEGQGNKCLPPRKEDGGL